MFAFESDVLLGSKLVIFPQQIHSLFFWYNYAEDFSYNKKWKRFEVLWSF